MMLCEICQSSRTALWASVATYRYYRCKTCRYLFVHPKPSLRELEEYYKDAMFYRTAESQESRLVSEAAGRLTLLSRLAEQYGFEKRLLDVGCASGIFLEQAQKMGWHATGIEFSPALVAKARSRGLHIIEGWLEDISQNSTYSVVTAWEVIEHALHPVKLLTSLRSCVSQGRLIALSTPLGTGLPARLLRSNFPMICPPAHLNIFSKKALLMLASRHGLTPICCRSFSHLEREQLERGLRRFVWGPLGFPASTGRTLSSVLSRSMLPLCKLMDASGFGSEMEIIFRCAQ